MTPADLLPRCTFPPAGAAVECAVSGGPDSTALLALAVAAGCVATAVHVDHGLRPGGGAEADVVAASAAALGAAFRAVRVEVGVGPNLEARARRARYAALSPDALTGHTADDQAETVLLNLLRGAGLDGLVGIGRPERRPLLGLRRAETAALCRDLGLAVVQDPTNDDLTHRRNRVRRHVLPLLDEVAGRDVAGLIARQSVHLRQQQALLDELAQGLDPCDVAALRAAHPALAAQALRAWLRAADADR
ncbi:MAG: tRNA lysidine(34) synthetase TilS, partial [Acidimicrobiales bacterium]